MFADRARRSNKLRSDSIMRTKRCVTLVCVPSIGYNVSGGSITLPKYNGYSVSSACHESVVTIREIGGGVREVKPPSGRERVQQLSLQVCIARSSVVSQAGGRKIDGIE